MFLFCAMLSSEEERERFTAVYEQYRRLLWCAANEILRDASLAEDAVQNAFLAVLSHMDRIASPYAPETKKFLVTVVRNKAIDLYRSRSAHAESSLDDPDLPEPAGAGDLLDEVLEKEGLEEIKACIRHLSPMHRTILEYRYLHEMSEKEIAEFLSLPPKRVNVTVYRARKKLQELLSSTAKERKQNG